MPIQISSRAKALWRGISSAFSVTHTPWEGNPSHDFWYSDADDCRLTFSGQAITQQRALQQTAVFGCVRILSDLFGLIPGFLYRCGPDDGRTRATDHSVYRLIHSQPNSTTPRFAWKKLMMAWVCQRGNAYNYIKRDGFGSPQELIPIHPDCVIPKFLRDGSIVYDVTLRGGARQTYKPYEILHLKGLTDDGLIGLSPIKACSQSLGGALAADEYSQRFFRNDGKPSGVIKLPNAIPGRTLEEKKKNREDLESYHRERTTGTNRHSTIILDQGAEWQSVSISPEDAQMLDTRKYGVTEICRIYGVPPSLMMQAEASAWGSGISELIVAMKQFTIAPWLVNFGQSISFQLLSESERETLYCEYEPDAMEGGDATRKFDVYTKSIGSGIQSINEIRRKMNLDPTDGGDVHFVPSNLTPITNAGKAAAPALGVNINAQ